MTNHSLTKEEFLAQLETKLMALPERERQNALAYYKNYLSEAEDTAVAISTLGQPGDVAADILASYLKRGNHQPEASIPSSIKSGFKLPLWLIVILIIFGMPIILGLGGGLIGIVAGIGSAIFAFLVSGVAMIITGAVSVVLSVFVMFQDMGFGLLVAGAGLVFVGVGILLAKLAIVICKGIFAAIQAIVRRFRYGRIKTA